MRDKCLCSGTSQVTIVTKSMNVLTKLSFPLFHLKFRPGKNISEKELFLLFVQTSFTRQTVGNRLQRTFGELVVFSFVFYQTFFFLENQEII